MLNSSPPLGILQIASVLRRSGVEVSALDQAAENLSIDEVVDWVVKEDPDILGISVLISSSLVAPEIAQEVKKKNPEITIVFGNHHATFNAERILAKYPPIDIVVRGEGERTCLELVDYMRGKKRLKDVLGITFRHNRRVISTAELPILKDVDSLPFPARDLLGAVYHNTTIGVNVAPKKFTSILSSRGCAFKCRFCSCTSMAHSFWRSRSIESILDELHFLESEGYRQLMFVDDNFTLNPRRVIELCQRMRKDRIDLEWICEGRVDQCSDDMLQEMVRAGCRMIYFGIESANQEVLDYYGKGITPAQSERAVVTARRAGMDVIVGSFIVGAPNETKEDVQKTLDFAKRLDIDVPQINPLMVNPGTPLWDEFKNGGFLDEELFWETGVYASSIVPNAVPLDELIPMIRGYYQNFLKQPRYIAKQIYLTLKSSYRLNIVFNNFTRIKTISDSINNLTTDVSASNFSTRARIAS